MTQDDAMAKARIVVREIDRDYGDKGIVFIIAQALQAERDQALKINSLEYYKEVMDFCDSDVFKIHFDNWVLATYGKEPWRNDHFSKDTNAFKAAMRSGVALMWSLKSKEK